LRLLRRGWPVLVLAAAAGLATLAVGSGFSVANDYAEQQIDPIGFLRRLNLAWVPNLYLGYHSGFMHAYATPYGWFSALLEALHVPGALRQHALDYVVFAAVGAGAYWGIGWVAPATTRSARLCGALVYLLSPYVAFNIGNGTSNMIAPYAALPLLTGITALALRGRLSPPRAGILAGVITFFAGGINVPLVAMNAIVVVLYVLVYLAGAFTPRGVTLRRLVPYGVFGLASALVLNLYWIVPFLDYTHTFWLGGLLDESPKEHSAESSFANVMRGLGQWAIFRGDATGPWYLWAGTYLVPFFSWILWFGPLLGAFGLALRRRATLASTFFAALAALSIPLAVGYYQGAAGTALSTPLYDFLYTKIPGFTMFRSAYKWVWPYEFAVAGLVVLAVSALQARVSRRLHVARVVGGRFGIALATCVVLLVAFGPILYNKMYHPSLPLPSWTRNERQFVGSDTTHRLALFPGQYLEWYDWLDRAFYLEAQNVDKPLVSGYMTGAPSEESHVVLTRSYKLARSGDRRARDLFQAMSVDDVLQRDDYRSLMDFAFVGTWMPTDTSLAHDVLVRILGARPHAQDGANRLYALDGALPLVFGTAHARFDTRPALVVTASGDYAGIARGETVVSPDGLSAESLGSVLAAGGLVASSDAASRADLAATLALPASARSECFGMRCHVRAPARGAYRVLIASLSAYPSDFGQAFDLPGYDFSHADGVAVPSALRLDGRVLRDAGRGARTWHDFGTTLLAAGTHALTVAGASPTTPALVELIPDARYASQLASLGVSLHSPSLGVSRRSPSLGVSRRSPSLGSPLVDFEASIQAHATSLDVPVSGHYALVAAPRRALSTALVREPTIAAAGLRPDPGFGSAAWTHPGATLELPYVPGPGMITLTPKLMPAAWYLDPSLYGWNRGSPVQWYLLRPVSHLHAIVPFAQPVRATLSLRLAGLNHAVRPFEVDVDGRRAGDFTIGGGAGELPSDAGRAPLGTEIPVVRTVSLILRPGVHDIALRSAQLATWSAADVDPSSAFHDQVVAALAPDVALTTVAPAGRPPALTQPASRVTDADVMSVDLRATRGAPAPAFAAFRLPLRSDRLDGVPSITTTATTFPGPGLEWLAIAVADDAARSHVRFRIVQNIGIGGTFGLTPSVLLPNSASDAARRIVDAWVVLGRDASEASASGVTQFALSDLHVERSLPTRVPETSLGSLRLSVDGRAVGPTAFLRAGPHTLSATDARSDIGVLRARSVAAPAARTVPLRVEQTSAVALDVRTSGATPGFVLVLNESFHPEWQADIDGHVLAHVHANGFANGWIVPAGSEPRIVHLRFAAQRTYAATVWVSLLGGFLCLGGLWRWRR
jgi:hypothetical protein